MPEKDVEIVKIAPSCSKDEDSRSFHLILLFSPDFKAKRMNSTTADDKKVFVEVICPSEMQNNVMKSVGSAVPKSKKAGLFSPALKSQVLRSIPLEVRP